MARVFDVTAPTTVHLDAQGRGEVTFVATNVTQRPLRGRARLVPEDAANLPWLTLTGEQERPIAASQSDRFVVKVAVPPGTKAGQYNFRLDLISVANPDEDKTQGPNVGIAVTLAPPPPPKPKWWLWLLIALAVIAVGALIVHFLPGGSTPAAGVASLTCSPASIGPNANSICTVKLNQKAATGGSTVTLASNNASIEAPPSVSVPAGSDTGTFNVVAAGSIASNQTATVTATLGGSQTDTINLLAPPPAATAQISGVVCSPVDIAQKTDSACMVTLTQAAPAGGATINLGTDNSLLTVPSTLHIPAGAVAQPFTATAAATIGNNQPATITASYAGKSQTLTVRIAAFFLIYYTKPFEYYRPKRK